MAPRYVAILDMKPTLDYAPELLQGTGLELIRSQDHSYSPFKVACDIGALRRTVGLVWITWRVRVSECPGRIKVLLSGRKSAR